MVYKVYCKYIKVHSIYYRKNVTLTSSKTAAFVKIHLCNVNILPVVFNTVCYYNFKKTCNTIIHIVCVVFMR